MRFLVLLICISTVSCNQSEDNEPRESRDTTSSTAESHSVDSDALTEEILRQTYLPAFSFEDSNLNEVLRYLSEESKKYGQMIGYQPVRFRAEENLGDTKVNLAAKGNSMRLICEMLAEQAQAELHINPHEVVFSRGVWDAID